jgi:hypothetical protein
MVFGADKIIRNAALLNALPHIVISHTNVLVALVEDMILH